MSAAAARADEASLHTAIRGTAVMFALHALCYMAISVPAVIAPVVAADIGIDASRLGILVATNYLFIMLAGLSCGLLIARYGPMRVCQGSAALSGLGLLAAAATGAGALAASQRWGVAMPGSALPALFAALLFASVSAIGFGMGLVNPVSSQVLFVSVPPRHRSLVFSIKQMGSPVGTAVAGLLIPSLLLLTAWPVALVVVSLPALLFVLLAPRMPAYMLRYEQGGATAGGAGVPAPLRLAAFVEPVRIMWRAASLRDMALVSTLLAMNQMSVSAFLVTYLTLEVGHSLVTAGSLFAITQLAGLVGRVVLGLTAERVFSPRRLLGLLGVIGGASAILLAMVDAHWSYLALASLCAVFGATSLAWNGVLLAEVARLAGPGQVGTATGGVQTFMSVGAIVGPIVFSALVAASGHYTASFIVGAIPVLVMGTRMSLTRMPSAAKS